MYAAGHQAITKGSFDAGGVAEDLSAVLSGGCPSYFKEDDKTFYHASGLLQRAEATAAEAERSHLTREALRLMMKVRFLTENLFGCM